MSRSSLSLALLATLLLGVVAVPAASPWMKQKLGDSPSAPVATTTIDPAHSVARVWNDQLLDAIRGDRPKPPTHARNLFHTSVAMWDAWAAYDPDAIGYVVTEKHVVPDVAAARREAISYAVYRLLMYRFPGGGIDMTDEKACQPGAEASQQAFTDTMLALGYDPNVATTMGNSPAALGNRIGQAVIDYGLADGAFEGPLLCYPDDTGYFPQNPELIFKLPGTNAVNPNRWQPLAFDFLVLQSGFIIGEALQSFVGVAWGDVQSFAIPPVPPGGLPNPTDCGFAFGAVTPIFDPGCPPQLGGVGDDIMKDAVLELIEFSSWLDPVDEVFVDLSPAVYGNKALGTDEPAGHPVNPFTCQPYAPNVMNRADWGRVIAEFWADGPDSETPPGHWNTLANYVTDHPALLEKRLGGTGPLLDDLEWDVKLYLAINGAVHDAAVAAWGTKHFYDSSRPISLVRYMGGKGQSTDPVGPSYHVEGLPLVPGLVEVITEETTAPGERHEHLAAHCDLGLNDGGVCSTDADCPDDGPFDGQCLSSVGQIAILTWTGGPEDPENEVGGVDWIRAIQWMPFQRADFVAPPFPGYTSGHSAFSRAAAEVLSEFTGSEYFPGGLGTFVAEQNEYLVFEDGPTETVVLQWATYADAADEAGLSRRFGGIHPYFDDYPGRVQGEHIGQSAFARALEFYNQELVDPGAGTGEDDEDDEGDETCDVPDDEGDDGSANEDIAIQYIGKSRADGPDHSQALNAAVGGGAAPNTTAEDDGRDRKKDTKRRQASRRYR